MEEEITTELLEREFSSAFLRVWETLVGLPLIPISAISEEQSPNVWTAGVVWLGGRWIGCVVLALPSDLAKLVASRMLDEPTEAVSVEQYRDAIRELANMSAGNLKSVLPGSCGLVTPGCFEVEAPATYAPEFPTISTLRFLCHESPVFVALKALH